MRWQGRRERRSALSHTELCGRQNRLPKERRSLTWVRTVLNVGTRKPSSRRARGVLRLLTPYDSVTRRWLGDHRVGSVAECKSDPGFGRWVWVDEQGQTHVSDDPERVPASRRGGILRGIEALRSHWDDGVTGPPVEIVAGASSREEDRPVRALRGAVDDLARGETARASAALDDVLRRSPNRPEAHWYLALLDSQRGRLDSAERHLRVFLSAAGDRFEPWRVSAERRLHRLADEYPLCLQYVRLAKTLESEGLSEV